MADKDRTPSETAKCRYCRTGDVPRDDGNHWIVKSIAPSRIDIRKCTAIRRATPGGDDGK